MKAEQEVKKKRKPWRKQRSAEPPPGVLIAQEGDWSLYERPDKASVSETGVVLWRSYKLVWGKRKWRRQTSYDFGFNGFRLSRSTDAGKLERNHPAVFKWVNRVLSPGAESGIPEAVEGMREEARDALKREAERGAQRAANPVKGDGKLLVHEGDWCLYERPSYPGAAGATRYRNYKLVWEPARKKQGEKRNFWFRCSGKSFVGFGADIRRLKQDHPEIFKWLERTLLR